MAKSQNIVGQKVRELRDERGLTQAMLVARLQILGWKVSRGTVAKVESGVRCVSDKEVKFLAKALRIKIDDLFK